MNAIEPLNAVEQRDVAAAIDAEIADGTYRKVNKRMALQLARALLDPTRANQLWAYVLAKGLTERLAWARSRIEYW